MRVWQFLQLLCLLFRFAFSYKIVEATLKADELSAEGRRLYDEIAAKTQSKDIEAASCWEAAFGNFQREVGTCEKLDDVAKNLISFALMRCHLADRSDIFDGCDIDQALMDYSAGKKTEYAYIIKQCKRKIPISAAGIQLQFFNHIELICFHFESKAWQQRTENLVARLSDTSDVVANSLRDIERKEDRLLGLQELSLEYQESLLGSAVNLQEAITSGHVAISGSLDGIKIDLDKAKSKVHGAFEEIFGMVNRVIEFQSFVSNQLWDFGTFLLYGGMVFVVHYLTTAESTKRSRGSMFLTVTLMVLGEVGLSRFVKTKFGTSFLVSVVSLLRKLNLMQWDSWDTNGFHASQYLFHRLIGWWRTSCLLVCVLLFLKSWWYYKDPETSYQEALEGGLAKFWSRVDDVISDRPPHDCPKITGLHPLDFPDYCSSDDSDWDEVDGDFEVPTVTRRNPHRQARPSNFLDPSTFNPILHFESSAMFSDRVELGHLRSMARRESLRRHISN